MSEIDEKVEKLRYKTVEGMKLSRGIAKGSTELTEKTLLVLVN